MALRDYPKRFLLASILSSLLVLVLCGSVAVFLAWEQSRTASILEENLGSRRAAADLEAVLATLIVLHQRGVEDVASVHERAAHRLADIEQFADKDAERDLVRRVTASYQRYRTLWTDRADRTDLVRQLQEHTLPACQKLQDFNTPQIDEAEREHRASLRQMTWGLAVVGGLGSIAGMVFGYGLARGLQRTIHQFLVRVQGAIDLLGSELSTVEWRQEGRPLQDGTDELLRCVEQVVVRLQQREREVRRAERLAALGQLAAGVAHEIRNPLTSALLLFQTARKDPSAGGLTEEDLDLIEQELLRIERSLQVFLDYARPPKLARTACNLIEVVRDAIALTRVRASQQGVVVEFDTPPEECVLDADRDQLRQVVLNLLLNSLDAMPHGGRLRLTIRPTDDETLELRVTDTGPGIPETLLPRLFEPFATGKETGVGLGLVLARRIVAEHGGSICGSNRPEGGAVFVVRLPYVPVCNVL